MATLRMRKNWKTATKTEQQTEMAQREETLPELWKKLWSIGSSKTQKYTYENVKWKEQKQIINRVSVYM